MKVLITGGSGFLGKAITKELLNKSIQVVHLTRNRNSISGVKTYEWDWEKGEIDEACFNDVTHIIHLAGASIAEKPWTMKRKRELIKSRVYTTRLLYEKIATLKLSINTFISASGIGFYGAHNSEKIFSEDDSPFNDFISKCCVQWENSVNLFQPLSRVVIIRLGLVLNKNEGGLPKVCSLVKKGLGASIGSGLQYMPWIHLNDAVNIFIECLNNEKFNGVYNGVAPEHKTNNEFTKEIAIAIKKKIRLPNIPPFILKTLYGELADLLLYGSKVNADKIVNTGFKFKYKRLKDALDEIYS